MSLNGRKMHHFIFSPLPLWGNVLHPSSNIVLLRYTILGHLRAPSILAARLVKEHDNLIVSIITSPSYFKNAEAEILSEFGEVPDTTRRRVRLFSIYKSDTDNVFTHIRLLFQTYSVAYQTLLDAKPITCAATGMIFEAAPRPSALFLDVYASPLMQITRALSGTTVPVIALCAIHVSFILHLYGPQSMGGEGDLASRIEAEAARRGQPVSSELGDEVFYHTEGKVTKVPGLPPMYDWEYFPQKLSPTPNVSDFLKLAYQGLASCDAAFSFSAYDLEKDSIDAMRSWFSEEWNKKLYTVGPLFASNPTTYGMVSDSNNSSSDIEAFLDKSLKERGKNSLVLISFGSLFWPIVQEYIEEVIDALIEKGFTFIVSYAPQFAKISQDLIDKVQAAETGLICKWIPQKFILNHPATGWFVTHAGQSGVMEALDSGTPMICWPFEFDQPCASAHLSENLNVAFDLIQIRTGEKGMKPLYRNGLKAEGTREAVGIEIRKILDECRGPRGEELRRNAQAIKTRFADCWKVDGVSRKDFNSFLEKYKIDLS
ncbi:UDP-glucosyltransferase 45 [Psilocybe cubensis]|uniref:UDP-Glycosyltransferase/glycogen phosphorylase n=2 Tax=Psilocybe cubensis TaxID=181762 RepID=A0A8H7XLH0_PSICU|nr:UDP-glucosyltransferase 45 [Psilocybe cubensis]KAH9476220.1 UDP-glucosyltransferase 45 [Psilocybe cubensis]